MFSFHGKKPNYPYLVVIAWYNGVKDDLYIFTFSSPNCFLASSSVIPQVPTGGWENTTVGIFS